MNPYIIFNGQMLSLRKSCVSPTDRGFLLGDGIFETMRSYQGQFPFLNLHLKRIQHGMSLLGFSLSRVPFDQMEHQARKLIHRNRLQDAYIRLTISRGGALPELLPEWGAGEPNWLLMTKPLSPTIGHHQTNGIKAVISDIRKNSFSPTARLKTINYIDMILAKREASLRGAHEAVLLDEKGHVAEAATSNLFWIKKEILYTPSLDLPILPGITRHTVLKIVREQGILCNEGIYDPEALMDSNEAFITNSICELTPLVEINGRMIGHGRPGKMTQLLQQSYKRHIMSMLSETSGES